MSYIEYYVDPKRRDEGFIFGLKSLRTVLQNIDQGILFKCGSCSHVNNLGVIICSECDEYLGLTEKPEVNDAGKLNCTGNVNWLFIF